MKSLKYLLSITFLMVISISCKKTEFDDISFIDNAKNAANITAMFDITQDNSGLVTITPNGEGAVSYEVYYGDGTTVPAIVLAGKSIQRKYAEGVYNVRIVAKNITGKITEATKQLTVSFRAPTNLQINVAVDPANNFKVNVSASALYQTNFKVFFREVQNEVPITFLQGQSISYTYAAVGTYVVKVTAFSGGAATTSDSVTIKIVDPILLPLTFESPTLNYAWTNFDGGVVTVINNPQKTGINTSSKVAQMVKNPGQPWGGSLITIGAPIDFSANKIFRMKVFSPRAGAKVLLKVENVSNGGISFEKEVLTTVANTWEDLAFDYRGINTSNTYQKIVLIFDNGTQGDGSSNFKFLIDDIRLSNQMPVGLLSLPITFDQAGINYEVSDFGGNFSEPAVDPVSAGNIVKKTTKTSNAATWAGTTMGAGFTSPIPFTSTQTQLSFRVYSPAAGIRVRLKVEDRNDNTKSVETEAMTQAANTWETLVFDFATQSSGTAGLNLGSTYNMASVFFDFGKDGTGKVFYWDDVKFLTTNVSPNYLALPLDFQSTSYTYPFSNFDGGNTTIVNNPDPSGINTSSKVAKMVKNAGQVWGGSVIELVNPINFSVQKTFKVKVFSPRIGAKLLLKVENSTNAGLNFEREVTTTTANTWEEITFNYSAINVGNSYSKIVLIFDLGTMGDGSANFTYYFDDIRLN